MRTYKEVAKEIITSYYENLASKDYLNSDGYIEIISIKSDDKVLLEHCKAIKNIMENAIKELEEK